MKLTLAEFKEEIARRFKVDARWQTYPKIKCEDDARILAERLTPTDVKVLNRLVTALERRCGEFDDNDATMLSVDGLLAAKALIDENSAES